MNNLSFLSGEVVWLSPKRHWVSTMYEQEHDELSGYCLTNYHCKNFGKYFPKPASSLFKKGLFYLPTSEIVYGFKKGKKQGLKTSGHLIFCLERNWSIFKSACLVFEE